MSPAGADPAARTALDIDLAALADNYRFFCDSVGSATRVAAVVKADAYGLGAAQVAPALARAGCTAFYTATAEEALGLRSHLPRAEIYALHGPRGAEGRALAERNIVPVLNSIEDIVLWRATAKRMGRRLPVALHLDTGMNRLGFGAKDDAALHNMAADFEVKQVMSHLACADDPAHAMNAAQRQVFSARAAALGLGTPFSLANSAGVLLGAGYHFDVVRPGCGLYGMQPTPSRPTALRPVVHFNAEILQVRDVDSAGHVGYAAAYGVAKGAKLAAISAGYADGVLRSLEGRGQVFIHGVACPVVGRVSMDLIVADITAVPRPVAPGDTAEILGNRQSIDDLARSAGTLGYEILTGLSRRYPRRYAERAA